ncbi:dTDP-4-dehydrorhamnose reductase [Pseudochrobactrum sp. AO18b]|uniref:dTDP-4-dehydrorhamnose reductase n=1 Tax=Pseudochrobactrum sp. AO18b TaxID=1201036 RepID=UPI00039A10DD|nr:dTDP-4-dehydrorhamnose reductase [Pseudochrobactrum sp. AO18b]
MKIAVTGKNGQIVRSLLARKSDFIDIVPVGRPELDLAFPNTVRSSLLALKPDFIVSSAAYTAVDDAEINKEYAYTVNAVGAGAVSEVAAEMGIPIIHLSTDYVFDGLKNGEYNEGDIANPLNVYGASKLSGEFLVSENNEKHIIIRTAWVYSPYGKNFVKTILSLCEKKTSIEVVSDQIGNPTSAIDIAEAIIHIIMHIHHHDFDDWGIYNVVGTGYSSRSDFARYIIGRRREYNNSSTDVIDVNTFVPAGGVHRPLNSRLSTKKVKEIFHLEMPCWKLSLNDTIKMLFE